MNKQNQSEVEHLAQLGQWSVTVAGIKHRKSGSRDQDSMLPVFFFSIVAKFLDHTHLSEVLIWVLQFPFPSVSTFFLNIPP